VLFSPEANETWSLFCRDGVAIPCQCPLVLCVNKTNTKQEQAPPPPHQTIWVWQFAGTILRGGKKKKSPPPPPPHPRLQLAAKLIQNVGYSERPFLRGCWLAFCCSAQHRVLWPLAIQKRSLLEVTNNHGRYHSVGMNLKLAVLQIDNKHRKTEYRLGNRIRPKKESFFVQRKRQRLRIVPPETDLQLGGQAFEPNKCVFSSGVGVGGLWIFFFFFYGNDLKIAVWYRNKQHRMYHGSARSASFFFFFFFFLFMVFG